MPFPVYVNPHLFSKGQSGKPTTVQSTLRRPPPDPHDVSLLPLLLHSTPCSPINKKRQADLQPCIITASKTGLYSVFPHLFISFFILLPTRPHRCLLQHPPFPSLSLHSLVSGWKVQWGCGSPEGQGVCLLPEHSLCAIRDFLSATAIILPA